MSNQDPLKNWQLENRGSNPEQWKLQDAEQDLSKHMQLQPTEAQGPQWQPIDVQREARPRGRNWVLPSIVIAALLGVLGYVGWIALGQLGGGGISLDPAQIIAGVSGTTAEPTATATPLEEAPVVAPPTQEPPPATETATPAPTATFTPEPTPTLALAELITGTVNAVGGVNARSEPATTGAVLRLLNQNEQVTALAEAGGWLQILLDDNTTAWVSAEFVDVTRTQVPVAQVDELRARAGLPLLGSSAPVGAPADTATAPPASAATVPVTVLGTPGINARLTPVLEGTVVQAVPTDTTLTAIGRTAAGDWLAVELPEGARGWVLAGFVATTGDLATLPVLDPAALAAGTPGATTEVTATVPAATAPVSTLLTTNGVIPAAPFTNTLPASGPALTISDTVGVNVRPSPSTEGAVLVVAPNGSVLPVLGRTADGTWLQVSLPDGQAGWMFAEAVLASSDAASAPVVDAAAAPAPVATTPPAAGGPTARATVTNPLGANLRSAPNRDLDPVLAVPSGEAFTAVGRTADNQWVQLALADGTLAWALASTVQLDAGIETLAVTQE